MKRKIYFEDLFSKRREKLVDLCAELQNNGKRYIYILPSREALHSVRESIMKKTGGIFNSHIIMFDELDGLVLENKYRNVVSDSFCKVIIKNICSDNRNKLKYYGRIAEKSGFIDEFLNFIKKIKRDSLSKSQVIEIVKSSEGIAKLKLQDLALIYISYEKVMIEMDKYKIEDLSLFALHEMHNENILDQIDAIIIDGFINYDKVYMKMVRSIAGHKNCDIYINASFKNSLTEDFIRGGIVEPLKEVGFEVEEEKIEEYFIPEDIKEISRKIYSGQQCNLKNRVINISKYPSIESELRETARNIKEKLMEDARAYEIAVFINNMEEYEKHLHSIFKEFNISIDKSEEIGLCESSMVMDFLKTIEEIEEELTGIQWCKYLEQQRKGFFENIKELYLMLLTRKLKEHEYVFVKSYEEYIKVILEFHALIESLEYEEKILHKKDVVHILRELINEKKISLNKGSLSGVKILNTDLAKGTFYEYIYVLGLNEGEVPKVRKNYGILNREEISDLNEKGLSYGNSSWELRREKIRLGLTLASGKNHINVSYRGASEQGNYLIESSFVNELMFLCKLNKKDITELSMRDRFNVDINRIMSEKELGERILKEIFENKYKHEEASEKIRELNAHINIEEKGHIELHRECGKFFNEFEGNLELRNFNLGDWRFSPSQITGFLDCPFAYYVERMLGLCHIDYPEDSYNTIEIGNFYHKILEVYFKMVTININGKEPFSYSKEKLERIAEEYIGEMRSLNLAQEEKNSILQCLKDNIFEFVKREVDRLNKYYKATKKVLMPHLIEEELVNSEIFGVQVKCFVDRADLEFEMSGDTITPTGKFVIYDYKKRTIKGIDDILSKKECQLTIYYYLIKDRLEREFGDTMKFNCMGLLYTSIEETLKNKTGIKFDGLFVRDYKNELGIKTQTNLSEELFYETAEYVKKNIIEAVEGMKKGRFTYPLNCEKVEDNLYSMRCNLKNLCRYRSKNLG